MKLPSSNLFRILLLSVVPVGVASYAAWKCQPFSDEGHFSDAARNLVQHGVLRNTSFEWIGTSYTRIDQHTYAWMPLYLLGEAGWMLLFPASLFSIRLFSVAWVPFSIAALWLIIRRSGGSQRSAWLGAAIYSTSFMLMDVAKDGRPELMCLALGWGGVAAYLLFRDRSRRWALAAANFLIMLSGLTHPNGLIYLITLVVVVCYLDRTRLSWRDLPISLVVYATGAVCWGWWVTRDFGAFRDQFLGEASIHQHAAFHDWHGLGILLLPFRLLADEFTGRYMNAFGMRSPFLGSRFKGLVLAAYFGSVIALLVSRSLRRNPASRFFLLLFVCVYSIQSSFNADYMAYLIHIIPVYCGLLGCVVDDVLARSGRTMRLAAFALLAALAVLQVGFVVAKSRTLTRQSEISQLRSFIAEQCGSARLIFADGALLHSLDYDPRLLDDRALGVLSGKRADVIVEVRYLNGNVYDDFRRDRPQVWSRIEERLAEYHEALVTPGFRILLDRSMQAHPVAR